MNMKALPTEQRNTDTVQIDEVSTLEMLHMINNEDKKVPFCVEKHLGEIATAIDAIAEKFAAGGRIIYCGAGTSGRMGFMDSAECPPTYGTPKERVVSLLAGGLAAIGQAKEDAEDHPELGVEDMKGIGFTKDDVLVGIAASGRTPYVIGALKYAKELGAVTVSISCNEDKNSPINAMVDYPIGIYAGPEAITGSTRMKAGTVQKLVLNMLSTGVMVKTGKVYSNLMVNVRLNNEKLVQRAKGIVAEITGAANSEIERLFVQTGSDVPLTIFMLLTGLSEAEARALLAKEHGHIKNALAAYHCAK
ncbi:putative PTS component; possibly regulatory [uncultured Eubacteriales bacterium]|uniref:N-acetylmuramic acid 6-phosphate etherase n=1 Tax=uncultured Eubacteriales bacterium TaxID=172733 RepID=A0A212KBP3_9FIRM|nr:putative PTS component; possibly regulatory [uncultured Eubacteriales bacterium]